MFHRLRPAHEPEKLVRVTPPEPTPEDKLAELILYIARSLGGRVDATRLGEYLYFADFSAMRRLGDPITGVEYRMSLTGPVPRCLRQIRSQLTLAGDARLEERADAFGHRHYELLLLREPVTAHFSEQKQKVMCEVMSTLRGMSAADMKELRHWEAPLEIVPIGETIPYVLAFGIAPSRAHPSPRIIAEGERLRALYQGRLAKWHEEGR